MSDQIKAERAELIVCGEVDYRAMRERQLERVQQVVDQQAPMAIYVCSHPAVITMGRGSNRSNILTPNSGVEVVDIERGGDVTYHGPGQMVVYPILNLKRLQRQDLHRYLRDLEEVVMVMLETVGLQGCRNPGYTGVWLPYEGEPYRKIASIGVAVKRWVTYHGFALNLSTDLSHFTMLNPCGLLAEVMTSLQAVKGRKDYPSVDTMIQPMCAAFQETFGLEVRPTETELPLAQ